MSFTTASLRIWPMRHGQTDNNKGKINTGHLPVSINTEGRRQAAAAGEALADLVQFDELLCSPMRRCEETAEHIVHSQNERYHTNGSPLSAETEKGVERRFTGTTFDKPRKWDSGEPEPAHAESRDSVKVRIRAVLERLLGGTLNTTAGGSSTGKVPDVGIMGHWDTSWQIRNAMNDMQKDGSLSQISTSPGVDDKRDVANTCFSTIRFDYDGSWSATIERWAETPHLAALEATAASQLVETLGAPTGQDSSALGNRGEVAESENQD